jgi:DNA-binding CsgD family transcriptional regulator
MNGAALKAHSPSLVGVFHDVLALLPFGVVVAAVDATVVHANPLAHHLFARRQALYVGPDGRLTAASAHATRELRHAIGEVVTGVRARASLPATMSPGRTLPMVVRGAPTAHSTESRLAIVFVGDPRSLPHDNVLSDLHGLTRAEARLALELLRGNSLAEAARHLGVTRNTVKSQLQRIFEKTGVTRQSELVRLLMDPVSHL